MTDKDKKTLEIDRQRDSAFNFELPNSDGIEKLISVDDEMIILCQNGVFKFRHADKTDPDRSNPDIVNTTQCLFPFGKKYTYSQWVFRTAAALFSDDNGLRTDINAKGALSKCATIARDFWDIETQLENLIELEEQALFRERSIQNNTIHLPSAPDYRPAVTGFFIKTNHIWRDLLDIMGICFKHPKWDKGYDGFVEFLSKTHGDDDMFFKLASDSLKQLAMIRNARNALEHPDKSKFILFRDYSLAEDNTVFLPAIKIVHPHTPHDFVSASMFMEHLTDRLAFIVEAFLTSACISNARELGVFKYFIQGIEGRADQHVLERYQWICLPVKPLRNS